MPIYEYTCGNHEFEILVNSWRDRPEHVLCEKENCGNVALLKPSLVSMQPDEMWSGKYVPALGVTFTSKKRMKQYLKDRNLAQVEPGQKTSKPVDPGAVQRRLHVEKHLEGYECKAT